VWHALEAGEVSREFWWGDLRKRDHLEYLGVDGMIILKWFFRKWNGLVWLRIGTGAGPL